MPIRYLYFLLFLSLFYRVEGQGATPLLILNMKNEAILPKHFRTSKDEFKFNIIPLASREGLDRLNISGSAQFSEQSLKTLLAQLGSLPSLYIIDLRQESHGFLNGIAVSWYLPRNWDNKGKPLYEIQDNEKALLLDALRKQFVTLHEIVKKRGQLSSLETIDIPIVVHESLTEQALVSPLKLAYARIPVTDHLPPAEENVDRFIAFIRTLPRSKWIHFHCAGGMGRTTTFMAMYDMMMNAKNVSFHDILSRQWLLGGSNLETLPHPSAWNFSYSQERLKFLQDFYDYCRMNHDNFQQNWSSYRFSHPPSTAATR